MNAIALEKATAATMDFEISFHSPTVFVVNETDVGGHAAAFVKSLVREHLMQQMDSYKFVTGDDVVVLRGVWSTVLGAFALPLPDGGSFVCAKIRVSVVVETIKNRETIPYVAVVAMRRYLDKRFTLLNLVFSIESKVIKPHMHMACVAFVLEDATLQSLAKFWSTTSPRDHFQKTLVDTLAQGQTQHHQFTTDQARITSLTFDTREGIPSFTIRAMLMGRCNTGCYRVNDDFYGSEILLRLVGNADALMQLWFTVNDNSTLAFLKNILLQELPPPIVKHNNQADADSFGGSLAPIHGTQLAVEQVQPRGFADVRFSVTMALWAVCAVLLLSIAWVVDHRCNYKAWVQKGSIKRQPPTSLSSTTSPQPSIGEADQDSNIAQVGDNKPCT